jgi:hypothetical protein
LTNRFKSGIIITVRETETLKREVIIMFKVYANSPMFYPLGTYSTFCEAKSVAEKALGHSYIEIIEYNEYGEAVGYTVIEK